MTSFWNSKVHFGTAPSKQMIDFFNPSERSRTKFMGQWDNAPRDKRSKLFAVKFYYNKLLSVLLLSVLLALCTHAERLVLKYRFQRLSNRIVHNANGLAKGIAIAQLV